MARSASGALCATWRASAATAASRSAAATTRLTRPRPRAASAPMGSPVKSSSFVAAAPMVSTSFQVSATGTASPMRASGIAKRALSAATRRSQCNASSQPPAIASPCTAASVGCGQRSRTSRACSRVCVSTAPPARWAASSARSSPAQKAAPAPRTTMTRTAGAAAARSTAARRSAIMAVVSALRLAGRFRVIEQT